MPAREVALHYSCGFKCAHHELHGDTFRKGSRDNGKKSRTGKLERSHVLFLFIKKGDTTDYSNFRPISLLPTIYKISLGTLSHRLTVIASELSWLSSEQKGFLPSVRDIDEHSVILQTTVEEARAERRPLGIAMLDPVPSLPMCEYGIRCGARALEGPTDK